MAKKWYPVIDYLMCVECGTCVAKCSHGVYDTAKAPSSVVKNPELCVDHCHGCGNRCPVGAITYLGEDTGWTPPNGEQLVEESYEVPPKEMLAEAILNAVFGQIETGCSCGGYELPENLQEFFKGKKNKSNCSCGGDCC